MADYYSSDEQAAPSEAQGETKPEMDKSEDGEQTALIPKTLFAGKDFKVGDDIVLKITHLYDDEAEVKYSSEDKDESKPKSTMEEAESGLEKMATTPMEG